MKTTLLLLTTALSLQAQDINFTNQTEVCFTNLQGIVYTNVTLVKAYLDGFIWRSGASGGRSATPISGRIIWSSWGFPSSASRLPRPARSARRSATPRPPVVARAEMTAAALGNPY